MRKKISIAIVWIIIVSSFGSVFTIECVIAAPNTPSNPKPQNGSTDVSVTTNLSWTGGDPDNDTVTYDVFFGTISPPTLVSNNQSTILYDPVGSMNYSTLYYWRIVAWDNQSFSTVGPQWEFITESKPNNPPNTPSNPSPTNGATNVLLTATLSWAGGDPDGDLVTYDVYFGTSSSPPQLVSNQSEITYDPGTMQILTTYYWKIIAWDNHGANTTNLTWNLTTRRNHPPSAIRDSYSTIEDTTLTIAAPGVLGNDSDPDGDTLTAVKVADPSHGTLTLNSNGSFTYIPAANYNGPDSFTYRAFDGTVNSDNSTVSITITAVNDSPACGTPYLGNGSTGNQLSLTWSILINDPEGDLFSWSIQCSNGQTNNGTAATNETKSLALSGLAYSTTYKIWVNATDPTGSGLYTRKWYTFTTKSYDGGGGGGGGGGEPPVDPQNKKPIANASAGEPYQGFVNSAVLFNGSRSHDPDGTITKWFWVFGDNTNGTGKTVTHMYSKAGTYTVTLTVSDKEGATNADTTTCVIKQPNRPPTKPIIQGTKNGPKNTTYTYTALSTDADNDVMQYTFNWGDALSQSSEFLSNGTSFTADHSWAAAGRYSLTVTVTDNQTESFSNLTVYIDALQTRGIGYLLDNDGDGIYDAFYSDVTKQTLTIQKKDKSYLIDSNGDGDWDYTFDVTRGLITQYYEPLKTPGFELFFVIGAIVVSILLWKKKKIV